MANKINLRGIVLTWLVLTSTFFWTTTMRNLFKPEISDWSIFFLNGKGMEGDFIIPVLIVVLTLTTLYFESRGKFRIFYYAYIVIWNLLICGIMAYGGATTDLKISFGTWGLKADFIWLLVPCLFFLVLTIIQIYKEIAKKIQIPKYGWNEFNTRPLVYFIILAIVSITLFQLGSGFDLYVKAAVGCAILQWILLAEVFGRPYRKQKLTIADNL